MKKYIILTCIIIIVLVISIVSLRNYMQYNKILSDENKQVDVLKDIIGDFKNAFSLENMNIYLDESSLKNLIDNVKYTDNNIEKLRTCEVINDNNSLEYIMYFKYAPKENILTITLKEKQSERMYLQRYKLDVKDNKITFERLGTSEIKI
ncbi:MAG: hypothetical protein IJX34_05060 [Clostridia bacterium]|nr:hypothetical protein [Clostridia bacterium]